MILVGMGAHHGGKLLHPLLLQKRHHQLAVVPVAAVNEHKLSVAFQKGAVRLAHVDKRHRKTVAGNTCRSGFRQEHITAAQQQRENNEKGKESFLHFVVNPMLFFAFFCCFSQMFMTML